MISLTCGLSITSAIVMDFFPFPNRGPSERAFFVILTSLDIAVFFMEKRLQGFVVEGALALVQIYLSSDKKSSSPIPKKLLDKKHERCI